PCEALGARRPESTPPDGAALVRSPGVPATGWPRLCRRGGGSGPRAWTSADQPLTGAAPPGARVPARRTGWPRHRAVFSVVFPCGHGVGSVTGVGCVVGYVVETCEPYASAVADLFEGYPAEVQATAAWDEVFDPAGVPREVYTALYDALQPLSSG